jgi:hypothetical protein
MATTRHYPAHFIHHVGIIPWSAAAIPREDDLLGGLDHTRRRHLIASTTGQLSAWLGMTGADGVLAQRDARATARRCAAPTA